MLLLNSLSAVGAPKTYSMGASDIPSGLADLVQQHPEPRNPGEMAKSTPFAQPIMAPVNDGSFGASEQAVAVAMRTTLDREVRARLKHEASWARSWELYNNRYACFLSKAKWQSKKAFPRVFSAVHAAAAMLTQQLTSTTNWFNMTGGPDVEKLWLDTIKSDTQESLDDPEVNFELVFTQLVVTGLLSQLMPLMVAYDDHSPTPTRREYATAGAPQGGDSGRNLFAEALGVTPFMPPKTGGPSVNSQGVPQRPKKTLPRLEVVDPFRIYKDSTNRKRYVIRTYRYTRGEFRAEAKRCGWNYVEEVIASATARGASFESPYVEYQEERNKDQLTAMIYDERDFVHIQVLWGDLYDESGEKIFENSWAVLANEQWLCMSPQPLPDWHGMPPIICPSLIDVPFSPYGKSLIGVSNDAVELAVEFINLLVDYFQKLVMGMVELDEHLLEGNQNPRVLYPGKVFVRSPEADPNQPTVRPVNFQEPSVQVWQFLAQIQNEWNEGTAMAGTAQTPRSKGRVSAMEYSRRQADAGIKLNATFKSLEQNLLEPFLFRCFMDRLQYTPQDEWDAMVERRATMVKGQDADVIRQMIGWAPEERVMRLGYKVRFRVRVFSAISDRQTELEKATLLLNVLKNDPVAMAHLQRWPFLRKVFEALGWDPEEFITKGPAWPQDSLNPLMMAQWQEQLQMMLQQLQSMQQSLGGAGQNVGAGPTASPAGGGGPGADSSSAPSPAPPGQVNPGAAFGGQPPNPFASILGATAGAAGGGPMTSAPAQPTVGQLLGGLA